MSQNIMNRVYQWHRLSREDPNFQYFLYFMYLLHFKYFLHLMYLLHFKYLLNFKTQRHRNSLEGVVIIYI